MLYFILTLYICFVAEQTEPTVVATDRLCSSPLYKKSKVAGNETELEKILEKAQNVLQTSTQINERKRDYCEIYGELFAYKLRKMDEKTRDFVMNEVDNFIYQVKTSHPFLPSHFGNISNSSPQPHLNLHSSISSRYQPMHAYPTPSPSQTSLMSSANLVFPEPSQSHQTLSNSRKNASSQSEHIVLTPEVFHLASQLSPNSS